MNCNACGAELPDEAAFCLKCGAKAGSAAPAAAVEAAEPSPGLRAPGGRRDDTEEELWQGGYSAKAMIGWFALALVVTVAAIVISVLFPPSIVFALGAAAVFWLFVLGMLAYRRINISYRLTTQRFFHHTGVLTRTTNRIEVIEMDDVTYQQTFFERFFGVGTIQITSSDRTDPVLVMPGIADVQAVSEIIDKARRKEITKRGLRIESV
jgi:membrane protein YdbS with pleckstrin-like domain